MVLGAGSADAAEASVRSRLVAWTARAVPAAGLAVGLVVVDVLAEGVGLTGASDTGTDGVRAGGGSNRPLEAPVDVAVAVATLSANTAVSAPTSFVRSGTP